MPFHELEDYCLRHILVYLRRDTLGNETVPSLIYESGVLRRVERRLRRLSRDTPSKFDAQIAYTRDGVLPRSFTGGVSCSTAFFMIRDRRFEDPVESLGRNPELFLMREPRTGRVWAVLRNETVDDGRADEVGFVLSLKHMVQLLSGHNADYLTRLDRFDNTVAGVSNNGRYYSRYHEEEIPTFVSVAECLAFPCEYMRNATRQSLRRPRATCSGQSTERRTQTQGQSMYASHSQGPKTLATIAKS